MKKQKNNIKYIIGLAVALALPLISFLLLQTKQKKGINIPKKYRVTQIDSTYLQKDKLWKYDTTFHRVNDLKLTNQLGQNISLNEDLKGKILVVSFFFTNCPTVCPQIIKNMANMQKAFLKKSGDIVQFISITVDPNSDSVPVLREYADRFDADHDRWWMLTGNSNDIYHFAQQELGLYLQPADANKGFDHSEKFVIIDSARLIRGYYNSLDAKELKQCADDVIIISIEKNK